MHFSSLLATAAMALSASAAPLSSQDADNWAKCANKTPDVAKAIELFCITNNKDNSINVPSLYTEFGYAYGGARVSITNVLATVRPGP
ncbi:hypothetical protein H2203_004627 [Taxawa tesnikishii (nom. ined.)]|nr:hypothetical protein H2203_004627 [Dothideales sp. JES 119]